MNKLKENGPEIWEYIHKDISRVFGEENVIMAGGCVRDYILSKEFDKNPFDSPRKFKPKDIDIFVNVSSELDLEFGMLDVKQNPQWNYLTVPVEGGGGPYGISCAVGDLDNFEGLVSVADGFISADGTNIYEQHEVPVDHYWNFAINLMANPLKDFTGASLVSRFDHSLCYCWYTPEKGIIKEGPFNKALETKKIEIINDTPRTQNRIRRLLGRYPEFRCDALPKEQKIKRSKIDEYFDLSTLDIPVRRPWVQRALEGDPAQELPILPE